MWSKSCNVRSENKYHNAARDGNVVLLRQGTKRDFNKADEDGMTPVHWAAYDGKLEGLRIITGRGGNPDLSDVFGNTALHHGAKNNHLHCVSYLINFGCNIWAVDNDGHSALDLAGLMEHCSIVKYLDAEMACRMANEPKRCEKLKEKAIQDAKKRIKSYNQEHDDDDTVDDKNKLPIDDNRHQQSKRTITQKFRDTFKLLHVNSSNFTQTIKSVPGSFGSSRLWRSTITMSATNKSEVIYDTTVRRESMVSSCTDDKSLSGNPTGLFERPGFGSISFRHLDLISMFSPEDDNLNPDEATEAKVKIEEIESDTC